MNHINNNIRDMEPISNNKRKIYIKKRVFNDGGDDTIIVSSLCKRKLVEAFGMEIYNEKERYGQDIDVDFFKSNSGHGVYN